MPIRCGRLVLGAVAALAVSFSGQTSLSAQSSDLIEACYVPVTGSMYRVNTPTTKQGCWSRHHTLFSWHSASSGGSSFSLPFWASVATTVPSFGIENTERAPTAVFRNTGGSHALFAYSQGSPEATIHAENHGGGATGYFASFGGSSALMGVAETGGGIGVMGISGGSGMAGHFENRSTGEGGALYAQSSTLHATINAIALGQGNAYHGSSRGPHHTMFLQNEGTGGALFALSNSPNSVTAHIQNTASGDATALLALAAGGSAFYAENTSDRYPTGGFRAYGDESALGVYSQGSRPTLQVNHQTFGPALNVNGTSFLNGVLTVSGDLHVTGQKNAVVPTSTGMRAVHAEESTEVWFTDHGFGRMENGVAWIAVDPIFSEIATLDEPYHVFVGEYGDAEVFVSRRTAEGFEVRVRSGADVEFSYRLMAKRRGYEDLRLNPAPAAEGAVGR